MEFERGERDLGGRSYGWKKWLNEEENGWRDLMRKEKNMDDQKRSFLDIYFIFYYFSYKTNRLY